MSIMSMLTELFMGAGTKVIQVPNNDMLLLAAAKVVQFDATTQASIQYAATATQNPVETETGIKRGSVSHAVLRHPLAVSFVGVFTETPLDLLGRLGSLTEGVPLTEKRRDAMWAQLVEFYKAEEPLIVDVPCQGRFPDMVITNLQDDHDPSTGQARIVTMEFQKIQIASSLFAPPEMSLDAQIAGAGGIAEMGEGGLTEKAAEQTIQGLIDGISGSGGL